VGRLGTIGIGLTTLRVDNVQGYDENGAKTSELGVSDTLISVGWGRELTGSGFMIGGAAKYLKKELAGASGTAMLADVGLVHKMKGKFLHGLESGLVVQNISQGIQFDQQKESLPRTMRMGMAYPVFGDTMEIAADYVQVSGEKGRLNFGMDYKVWQRLALRMGYQGGQGIGNGLAYGMGMGMGRWKMDYAYSAFGELGGSHRISVGYKFGGVKKVGLSGDIERGYQEAMGMYGRGDLMGAYMRASSVVSVAPWHEPSINLMRRVEGEMEEVEGAAQKAQVEQQMENHFEQGLNFFNKDELVQAKKEFELVLAMTPDHARAKEYLKRIDERFAAMAGSFYDLGVRLFETGQYQDAKATLQKVLVMNPGHPAAYSYIEKINLVLTEQEVEAQKEVHRHEIEKLFDLARAACEEKRYEDCIEKSDEVLELDESNEIAKQFRSQARRALAGKSFDRAMTAMQMGDLKTAVDGFRRAVHFQPDYTEAQTMLKNLQGRLEEQQRTESIRLYKDGLDALASDNRDEAKSLIRQSLNLWPENPDAKRMFERLTKSSGR
jgi:tetratricopeptide (TPR) repeat protein